MSRIKINDKITAQITDIDEKGRGVFSIGTAMGLASGLVPGEIAEGTVIARRKGKLRLSVGKFVKTDLARGKAPCPFFGQCGGCLWQDLVYERQCELKLNLVNKALADVGIALTTSHLRRATHQYHHRNRMDFVFALRQAQGDGRDAAVSVLGLKEHERWDKVVNLDSCLLLDETSSEILRAVRKIAAKSGAPFWDNRAQRGYWRYLVIREGKNSGERLVLITTSGERNASHPERAERVEGLPYQAELVEALRPLCTSFLHGVNPEVTDLSIPKTIEAIFGEPYLHEKVNGSVYRIPPASFFQTNTEMAGELQKSVVEFAQPKKTDRVLDLYCGSGFLTLALAACAKEVLGLEIDAAAVDAAMVNAELNSVKNADFRAGAAEKTLPTELAASKPDIIVVDPPRAGLHPSAAVALAASDARRIVYVSCNPLSLARDLKTLLGAYRVSRTACLDLFPHTPHIETIIALDRK
jgi:23S rRNA (uracil1939-C5)-methyltransferase